MSETITVPCIKCGTVVRLTTPRDHSEHVPSGKCPKCKTFHYASYGISGDLKINATEQGESWLSKLQ